MRPKIPNKHARRTYITDAYKFLLETGRIKKDGMASRRYDYLRLNNFNLNT